jgi:uncharacterized membrane protein YhfC
MIPTLSIIGMAVSGAIAILLPVVLAIVFYRSHRFRISFLFMGAAAFFISQIILRSTILNLLALTSFHKSMVDNLVYLVIIGAFSAGLFEESARYGGFSLLKKNGLTWADAVAFGIGHGGVESILLVGLSQISNVVTSILIQTGTFDSMVASSLGEKAGEIKAVYLDTAPALFFASGLERILVMPVHICLSVLVCLAIIKKKPILLIISILLHTLVNVPAVFAQVFELNIWLVEGILFIMSAAMLYGIIRLKKSFPEIAAVLSRYLTKAAVLQEESEGTL